MASPGNQHCASSIGTLSFPTGIISVLHKWPTVLRNRVLVTVDFGTGRRGYYPHSGPALLARSLAALRVALPLHCLYRHGAWAYNSTTESYGAANFVYSLPKTRRARKNSAAPVTAMMRRIFRPPQQLHEGVVNSRSGTSLQRLASIRLVMENMTSSISQGSDLQNILRFITRLS